MRRASLGAWTSRCARSARRRSPRSFAPTRRGSVRMPRRSPRQQPRWIGLELDRTRAAFDGDELVGTSRNYTLRADGPGWRRAARGRGQRRRGAADPPAARDPAVDDGRAPRRRRRAGRAGRDAHRERGRDLPPIRLRGDARGPRASRWICARSSSPAPGPPGASVSSPPKRSRSRRRSCSSGCAAGTPVPSHDPSPGGARSSSIAAEPSSASTCSTSPRTASSTGS